MDNNNNPAPSSTIVPSKSSPSKVFLIIPVISIIILLILVATALNYMNIISLPGLSGDPVSTEISDLQSVNTASIPLDPGSEIVNYASITYGLTGVIITDVVLENGVYKFSIMSPDTKTKITNVSLSENAKIAIGGIGSTGATLNDAENQRSSIRAHYDLRKSAWSVTSIVVNPMRLQQPPPKQ